MYLEGQLLGHDDTRSTARLEAVGEIVADVFERADHEHITTVEAATAIAHARLTARRQYPPQVP